MSDLKLSYIVRKTDHFINPALIFGQSRRIKIRVCELLCHSSFFNKNVSYYQMEKRNLKTSRKNLVPH